MLVPMLTSQHSSTRMIYICMHARLLVEPLQIGFRMYAPNSHIMICDYVGMGPE